MNKYLNGVSFDSRMENAMASISTVVTTSTGLLLILWYLNIFDSDQINLNEQEDFLKLYFK